MRKEKTLENKSKNKTKHKWNRRHYMWYGLLIYGVMVQFIMVAYMGQVGNQFIMGNYILKENIYKDAAIMIGIMGSALLVGIIRQAITRAWGIENMPGKKEENCCIVILAIIELFLIEWVVAGVNLMLLPVWFLLEKFTEWQEKTEKRKKEKQNMLIKEYIKEHIAQLPAVQLCDLAALEKKRFAFVLKQNRQSLGSRVIQGILSVGRRMGNSFIFLAMGSILCVLVYEGEMAIWEALLFLFALNAMLSSLNFLVSNKRYDRKVGGKSW